MGFLTRLLAGLTAAAALGAGLTGTANAVDTTDATGTTKSVVKLTADDTNNLPDHLVNGDFSVNYKDQWLTGGWNWTSITPDGKYLNSVRNWNDSATTWKTVNGWDKTKFGWSSTQKDGTDNIQHKAGAVEVQYDDQADNVYGELCAYEKGTAIYQDIKTAPGTLYKIRLKHASLYSGYLDKMQVMVGAPGHEQAVEMTRTSVNGNGDTLNEKSTTIATKVSNTGESDRNHENQWETYEGTYLIPDGQTTTRFTFRSVDAKSMEHGNLLDDIVFDKAYKLSYDKNASDASGQVPSNERGRENTVQPAESKTDGNVKTVSDDAAGRTVLECKQSGEGATGPYADKFCWIDWSNLPLSRTGEPIPVRINVPGGHIDADATVTHTDNAALTTKDFTGNKWSWLIPAYRLTGNTALAFHHIQGNSADPLASVMFSNITPVANQTAASVNVLKDFQLAFGDAETMSGYVVNDRKTYERTDIESDKTLDKLGMIGDDNPNQSYSEANTGYGTTHVTLAGGPAGKHAPFTDDSNSKGAAVIGATQPTRFKVSFKQVNHPVDNAWSAIAVGVYMPYLTAYPLTYDKNSSNATGEVPSNQRGKENTTQPAASKTNGTVKTVADDTSNLSDHLVNGDFEYPGANVLSKHRYDEKDANWWGVSRKDKMVYDPSHEIQWVSLPSTFDSDRFAWDSTEVARVQNGSSQWHTNEVELQRDSRTGNMYGELCAYQANTSIRQYIRTTPGVLYKVRLKHASLSRDYLDKMQVLIGPGGNEQPVRMTRVESQNGLDSTGESTASTTISTHASNEMEIKDGQGTPYSSRNHNGQWATYEGVYVATSDVTSFTFKSVDSKTYNLGNLLDDIVFDKAYRLSYDKNATDANGSVPSDETAGATKQAKSKTNGSVRLAADDDVVEYAANGLPKQLVNSDFDHDWRNIVGQSKMTGKYNFANVDPAHGDVEISGGLNSKGEASKQWVHLNGFDAARFGWKSNQTDTRVDGRGGIVEIQRSKANDNMYAEITASQANTYLYQDIDTAHSVPTVYTVKLRYAHRNGTINSNEKIQILVGAPGHEQPVEMTRIASDRGNKVGEKSTTVNAPNTDGWLGSWDTFQGSVEIPAGQPVSRFTFKALGSIDGVTGNLIDDVQFELAYPLSYDKNAQDATGSVPSSQYGKENTVQPAKTKTSGTVKTVADTNASLPDHLVNGDFSVNYHDQWKDSFDGWTSIDPNTGKTLHATNTAQGSTWKWTSINGWNRSQFGWTSTQKAGSNVQQKANAVELQYDDAADNVYAELCAYEAGTAIYQDIKTVPGTLYKVRLRHASLNQNYLDKMQVMIGTPGHETPVEMTRTSVNGHGDKLNEKSTTIATKVTNGNNRHHESQWETYEGTYLIPDGQATTRFTFKSIDAKQLDRGNVLDDIVFDKAYRLSYDKNATDANGEVPSNQRGKENTVQPAEARATGTVRTVADKTSDGLTVHDLKETDGKVSDLVQRTTTHEDGSVTVRTVDQSTDVVSGCQVYYPAGQRITLATLAKDDDCWDSAMLTRPGHTQLGWNQDRNATQAQAEVTMVEGGMTVYAVWVGNPVLTYDTNKPSTWSGQMPSTPASVSVPYNTAVADGSGWRAGDTTKIRGYRFLGWYTGPQDNAGLYDWTRPLTGSVTVYAHWQRLQANVIYNANGGTGSHPNTTGWQYSDVTIPGDTSKSFKHDGLYLFKHWNTQPNDQGTVYTDGSRIALQDKDITLYAIWVPYHEHFVPTGGIGLPIAIAGGVLLLMFGIGSTVMLTRRMNGHGMPDDE